MSQTIRAIYHNGLIEPLEKLNLTENTEITVTISKRELQKQTANKRFSIQGIFEGGGPIPEEAINEAVKEWNKVKELQ